MFEVQAQALHVEVAALRGSSARQLRWMSLPNLPARAQLRVTFQAAQLLAHGFRVRLVRRRTRRDMPTDPSDADQPVEWLSHREAWIVHGDQLAIRQTLLWRAARRWVGRSFRCLTF